MKKMRTSTRRSPLTWVQNFLSFWVTRTEGGVELEVVHVVEERWAHGEEDVLESESGWKIDPNLKVKVKLLK